MNNKFAIIGKGFIFKPHEEAIRKAGGEIIDLIDKSAGSEAWQKTAKETMADCIVILAPNHLHFEMSKFSAQCGKTVLCEKPLALKSEEAESLISFPNIFTVYQLRYHPLVQKLKSEIKQTEDYRIEMNISVHRDQDYWQSWKGEKEKSGGMLVNLGIHYFDLLLYLFGEATDISNKKLTARSGEGNIFGKNYSCDWKISAEAEKGEQCRLFRINGIDYDFSSKENLHFYVYKDLLEGKGVRPQEAVKSIELIEKIYEKTKK